jgi:hypothetical protein
MNAAWQRMIQRKAWPAEGFIRSLEVTRGEDGSAHPHFHCLLAVPPSYFGRNYLSTAKWAAMWQEALRIDYTPICDVRLVKPKAWDKLRRESPLGRSEVMMDEVRGAVWQEAGRGLLSGYDPMNNSFQVTPWEAVKSAIAEVIKYTVKPDDMLSDPEWLLQLSSQLRNSRAVAIGGALRGYFADEDTEGLVNEGEPESHGNQGGMYFGWREDPRYARYKRKRQTHNA